MRIGAAAEIIEERSATRGGLTWLTAGRRRLLLVVILAFGFASHLRYLVKDCPIDLSGDEAHYWDWSRQLDWSYYSKGPLVAWIIRASCAVFGDTMVAVRVPALLLAVGTSLLTYWLTLKLFASERVALGAVLLNHLVPMFVAGSVLMTIDPPFFFCWAAATCLAAKAVFDDAAWIWPAAGVMVGIGFLAKYAMFLWPVGLFVLLAIDGASRRKLCTAGPYVMLLVAALFTIPVIVWNAKHGWVSLRHVARQTGTTAESTFSLAHAGDFLAGQLFAIGPALVVIIVGACFYALRRKTDDPHRRAMAFLACVGLAFFAMVAATSLRTKIQVNWPAPAYFTLLILATYFLATRLRSRDSWRRWRGWFWGTVVFGILFMPIAHDTSLVYRAAASVGVKPSKWDPTYKLRGWRELGDHVSQLLATMPPDAIVMAEKYDATAELAFYVTGHPKTYYVGSWIADPERRDRHTQYDLWPDRRLDQSHLRGRDAIFVGYEPPPDMVAAFERIETLPPLRITRAGIEVRTFRIWRCHGFKGMTRPNDGGKF